MGGRRLIVGIDPGTTTGLAILDSNGDILSLEAEKGFSTSEIIEKIFKFGKPLIIATDKSSCPSLVKDISAKLEARLFLPEEDLKRKKKRELVKRFEAELDTKHEKDALAAALYSFKQLKDLFRRIRYQFSEEEKIKEVKEKILLGEAKNIEEALEDD